MNSSPRFPPSNKWIAPKVQGKGKPHGALPRTKLCPYSPFFGANLDVEKHRKEWEDGRRRRAEEKMNEDLKVKEEKQHPGDSDTAAAPDRAKQFDEKEDTSDSIPENATTSHIRKPFDGKEFETNHSTVLSQKTVFCQSFEKGKEDVADWPNRMEAKYEGDDRLSTDRLHGRFLGAPRVTGNETVNWQHRAIIPQFPFDDFYYPVPNAVDIFMRTHWVSELEFTDEEGEEAIGKDLMQMLDFQDQWT